MKIIVTGSTGLVGTQLVSFLEAESHIVSRLVRSENLGKGEIYWNPSKGVLEASQLEGFDAVVHLAGESIAGGRWTPQKKARIRDSRVDGTQLLCDVLSSLEHPPSVLISASAMGYYGNRGTEILTEESEIGSGFLSEIGGLWEEATAPAQTKKIRVVNLRFGLILSLAGGAFAKLLFPFRLGLGGRIGNGEQYMSWIVLEDVLQIIAHALKTETLQGPVNVGTPHPVTNSEFTKILGRVLSRPTVFPLPAFIIRTILGEMGEDLLLSSTRMTPDRLLKTNYTFQYPTLEKAFRYLLHS